MKFSVCATDRQLPVTTPFPLRGESFRECAATAEALGYNGIELQIQDPADYNAAELRRLLSFYGLEASAITTGLAYTYEGMSMTHTNKKIRQATVERLKRQLDLARELDSQILIGFLRGRKAPGMSDVEFEDILTDTLGQVVEYGESIGTPTVFEQINRNDGDVFNSTERTMSFIEKLLKGWFFGLGKVKAKESHKADVKQKIKTILSDYTREFLKTRQTVLEKVRDSFIEEIQTVIRNNGNISEQAKAYVCEIIPPEVKTATNLVEFGDIYDSNRRTENVLFWERTTVDKESFKEDVTSELATITGKMASDFTEDYKKAVSTLLNQVQAEFVLNMDNYSILMKAKLSDKKAMEELHKKIVSAEEALLLCQQDLNSTIWSVNNNG